MINVLIPAAGKGSRFAQIGIETPKPLIYVKEKSLIQHSVDSLGIDSGTYMIITRNFYNSEYNDQLSKIIKAFEKPAFEIFTYEFPHFGAAHTCLMAEEKFEHNLWMDQPLIITNCDQLLLWDAKAFVSFIEEKDPDGAVVLFNSDNPKNSFAEIVDNKIVRIVEKQVISNAALVGIHYWKRAKDFFKSAKKLDSYLNESAKERYVSETYNFLIKDGKEILPYFIDSSEFVPLGTPEDVTNYLQGV